MCSATMKIYKCGPDRAHATDHRRTKQTCVRVRFLAFWHLWNILTQSESIRPAVLREVSNCNCLRGITHMQINLKYKHLEHGSEEKVREMRLWLWLCCGQQ